MQLMNYNISVVNLNPIEKESDALGSPSDRNK